MKRFYLIILMLMGSAVSQGQILLYENHFETPRSTPVPNCGPDLDATLVNTLWGGTGTGTGGGGLFTQQHTVETILIHGPNNQYNDPSGIGGNYSLGLLSVAQDDKLSLTLNAQNFKFINLSFSLAGIDLGGCGGPFGVSIPVMNVKLYNTPSGTFDFNSLGTLLDEKNLTGIAASSFTFNWATVSASLNAAGITNQFFTVVFDLTASGYGSIDNVVIMASNNAPVVTTSGGSTSFTTQGVPVAVDGGVTVTDLNDPNLASAMVSITSGFQNTEDILQFINQNGIAGSYNAATGVLTLTGSSSVANYQTALRSVLYNNTSSTPNTANRTISFVANDGTNNSNIATKIITITAASCTPSVSIAASQTTICAGTNVTFTATPTNGGTTPSYQWKVNGVNIGTNSSTFSSSTLNNNDVITVVMTSNSTCASTPTATSNAITITVTSALSPSVSITASSTSICSGTSVTFTATPTNGGTNPSYQWKVNGVNAGTNSSTLSSSTLNNNDVITVVMTSNASCLTINTATSNAITMTVNAPATPTVSIAASATTICAGTSVTFTATPTSGGTLPSYQWKVNGVNAGTNSPIFSSSTLTNNSVVTVVMNSNASCITTPTATSNAVTITVGSTVVPSVSITASQTTICAGTSVTFTAIPTNGGTTPSYQWKVNGVNAGTNSSTFSSSTLNNNDVIMVVMTSNASCISTTSATSNSVSITVTAPVIPSVSITASQTTICAGTSVTFTASPVNGGATPSYQWKINGVNAGTNSPTFSSSALTNNSVVTVVMTSNASCITTVTATSNAVTITVTSPVTPSVSIAASAATICAGINVTFTPVPVNGGANPSYQWRVNGVNAGTNSPTFSSPTLNNNDVVTVVMTSNATCVTSSIATSNAITATVNPIPVVNAGADKTIASGDTTTLHATANISAGSLSYMWSPAAGLSNAAILNPVAKPSTTTNYKLIVTSAAGCSASDEVLITVLPGLFIPHGFSPNGDGVNDVWNIRGISAYPGCMMKIFDRYGRDIFSSTGYNTPWDGKYKGNSVPVDTYYYILDLKNGSQVLSGFVTIIK